MLHRRTSVQEVSADAITSRLRILLEERDLDFHGEKSSGASHSLHAFAAKFPPQLPALFIRELTRPGDLVVDPMVGSGTTIVEAYQLGRNAVGVDIDPLALMLCRAKTTRLRVEDALEAGHRVLTRAAKITDSRRLVEGVFAQMPDEDRRFVDYWFARGTQVELASLISAIREEPSGDMRNFLELLFSSIIITKSGGVSLARDLAHSRPHKDGSKKPRSAHEQFELRLERAVRGLSELREPTDVVAVRIEQGDCRVRIPVESSAADLIVTSPPYANAIDYMRAHKFSLVWFGKRLSELSELRGEYIGAERITNRLESPLPLVPERVVRRVAQVDLKKAAILRKYFSDMEAAMGEMYRILKPNRAAVIVVGPSTMRGYTVDTPRCLGAIGVKLGFELVGIKRRRLDRNRRMMPARFHRNGQSPIELRMHAEHVIGLVKT